MNSEKRTFREHLFLFRISLFITFLILATFYPVFESGFTNWDDPVYVTANYEIRSLSPANIGHIFTSFCSGHYHPLTVLSFATEYNHFYLSPFFYHADNLLLHYFNCLLVLWLLLLLTKNMWASFFAAALFAVHPMHVESVAWVSGRKDVLFAFFYLSSFISYIYYRQNSRRIYFLISAFLFILSLLAKESAVTLPLIFIAYDYFILGKIKIKDKLFLILLSLGFGAVAIYSEKVSGAMMSETRLLSAQAFGNFIYSFLFYLEKLFFPFKLSCFYPAASFSKSFLLRSAAALSILTACFVYYKNRKEAAFALVFYFVNIILFFQFIPVGYAVVCDRYTYVPYIGLAMLISGGVTGIIELNTRFVKYLAVAFAIIFVGSLSFLAHQRSKVWLDSYTLWNDAIKNNSSSARAFANRGFAFIENRAYDQALADLKRSAELDFNSAKVHFAMANAYMFKKQYDKAADCYCNAIKVDPSAPSSYLHLGLAYNMLNRDIDALQQFTKAASICPVYPEAYYAMGNTYFKIKEYDRAVESFTEALRYSQNNFFLYGNRGYSYFKLAKYDKALADFNRALELNPYYTPARKHREEVLKFINR